MENGMDPDRQVRWGFCLVCFAVFSFAAVYKPGDNRPTGRLPYILDRLTDYATISKLMTRMTLKANHLHLRVMTGGQEIMGARLPLSHRKQAKITRLPPPPPPHAWACQGSEDPAVGH